MLDVAALDTYVVDDPDAESPPLPRRSRVPTEELTMHVLHEGTYHRTLPDLTHTSCGEEFRMTFAPLRRREELKHPLCRGGCFTPFELSLADEREQRDRDEAANYQTIRSRKETHR